MAVKTLPKDMFIRKFAKDQLNNRYEKRRRKRDMMRLKHTGGCFNPAYTEV